MLTACRRWDKTSRPKRFGASRRSEEIPNQESGAGTWAKLEHTVSEHQAFRVPSRKHRVGLQDTFPPETVKDAPCRSIHSVSAILTRFPEHKYYPSSVTNEKTKARSWGGAPGNSFIHSLNKCFLSIYFECQTLRVFVYSPLSFIKHFHEKSFPQASWAPRGLDRE